MIIAASATVAPIVSGGDNEENIPNASQYTPSSLEETATPVGTPVETLTPVPVGVSFRTQFIMNDGLIVYAQTTNAVTTPAPLLVFLPDVGGSKDDFSLIAPILATRGFSVLTIDRRGTGETGSTYVQTVAIDDLRLTMSRVRSIPGIDPTRISLIGAGVGANLALYTCAELTECRALILLSPTVNGGGVDTVVAMTKYGERPVLITVARTDEPSARDSVRLGGIARTNGRLIIENGAAHGTELLTGSPDLTEQVIAWLAQNGV